MLKSSGFLTKLLLIASLLILVFWSIPRMLSYYETVESYSTKKSELEEARVKYNISQNAQQMKIDAFKKEIESIVSDVEIEPAVEPKTGYSVTVQMDKNKIKKFNSFIETLSLRYLVKIRNNELFFEEKEPLIEVKFILESL
jgi:hypothetical protein